MPSSGRQGHKRAGRRRGGEIEKMLINLNVKIKGGPRTPVEVDVYGTAVNSKTMKFANGETISEDAIAIWITHYLTEMLSEIEDKI